MFFNQSFNVINPLLPFWSIQSISPASSKVTEGRSAYKCVCSQRWTEYLLRNQKERSLLVTISNNGEFLHLACWFKSWPLLEHRKIRNILASLSPWLHVLELSDEILVWNLQVFDDQYFMIDLLYYYGFLLISDSSIDSDEWREPTLKAFTNLVCSCLSGISRWESLCPTNSKFCV